MIYDKLMNGEENVNRVYQDALALFGIGGAHPGGLGLTKNLLQNETISEQTKILDAGCGTGQTSAFLYKHYQCSVTPIDYHPLMVEKANQRFKAEKLPIRATHGSIESLPFPDHTFDLILAESVTAFTTIPNTLKEFCRVLKPKGVLINLDMTAEKALSHQDSKAIKDVYGVNQVLTENEWHQQLAIAGFQTSQTVFSGTILTELFNSNFQENHPPEFQLSAKIDPVYEAILLEHQKLTVFFADKLGFRVYRSVC